MQLTSALFLSGAKTFQALISFWMKEREMTALHWAAFNGYFDVVKYLVEAGANVDAKNSKGETPLDIARKKAHTNIIELFEEKRKAGH
ncbi:unnamed protein product [Enterobius vermicularis]|uniref:ANK_REP_REGION domain-containing protein n=1 Tax=Enterobius vermicularis TaxID=51028 RepID=A0A0N4V0V9_ENTVE|nr:unnamed protein product [Enterobius vermicularis]